MDAAVENQKDVAHAKRGDSHEILGSLNKQRNGTLKVQKIPNAHNGRIESADTASGTPPVNSKAVVHGHLSTTLADDPSTIGDADPLRVLTIPNYAVSRDGRIMIQELDDGRYQVRMVSGEMTDSEIEHYKRQTDARQQVFYDH